VSNQDMKGQIIVPCTVKVSISFDFTNYRDAKTEKLRPSSSKSLNTAQKEF